MNATNLPSCGFGCSGRPPSEKERNRKDTQIVELFQRLKKQQLWNMRVTVKPIIVGAYGSQRLGKKIEGIGNQRKTRNHPKHRIVEIHKILIRVLESLGGLLSLRHKKKTTNKWWCKKFAKKQDRGKKLEYVGTKREKKHNYNKQYNARK